MYSGSCGDFFCPFHAASNLARVRRLGVLTRRQVLAVNAVIQHHNTYHCKYLELIFFAFSICRHKFYSYGRSKP